MKKIISLILILSTLRPGIRAQDRGIQFEQKLSWSQVLQKATQEQKFIFMDCYATWCGPCKKMDLEVYPKQWVGDYINTHFISIKVQMDTGKDDAEFIKVWYANAQEIKREYKVSKLPTYLFFSPNGIIVHRSSGAMTDSSFLALATDAMRPGTQYYSKIEQYTAGLIPYGEMPPLALEASSNGDDHIAEDISKVYIRKYLDESNRDKLLANVNIPFMKSPLFFTNLSSKDKVFSVMLANRPAMDSLVHYKGYVEFLVNRIINQEIINPALKATDLFKGGNPDWAQLTKRIDRQYGRTCAEKIILDAKLRWYGKKEAWPLVVRYNMEKIEKYGLDTSGLGWLFTNNILYEIIFEHATDARVLLKAAKWMELINHLHPDDASDIDTYANLLYKAGKINEAMAWEEKAVNIDEEQAKKYNSNVDNSFRASLEKMKKNEPTWSTH